MPFRILLLVMWLLLIAYTGAVIASYGVNLLPIFFGDMVRLTWPGQFNFDFLCFLMLSALWTAWRNGFSARGLALSPLALFGGAGFLLPYLFILVFKEHGDMRRVLLGSNA